MRLILALLIFLLLPVSAHAERVLEVQNIHIEQSGSAGRDAAVAEATRQAAQQVWTKIGHSDPLPELSADQLQNIASYVDVTNEVAQQNYYAATFNIGIQVDQLTGNQSANEQAQPALSSDAETTNDSPSWVLVVPAHSIGNLVTLWKPEDVWTKLWQRAPGSTPATAVASGDTDDAKILSAAQVQSFDPDVTAHLRELARKYGAPAVALVVLNSQHEQIMPNEEVRVEVSYIETSSPDQISLQSSTSLTASNTANPAASAIIEAQRLIQQLATGQDAGAPIASPTAAPPVSTTLPAGQPGLSPNAANTYAAAPASPSGEQKLWVRIPLATPMDLGNFRKKIEGIPGARFQITALNRLYVEGNILYTGTQAQLMSELTARGLRQQ